MNYDITNKNESQYETKVKHPKGIRKKKHITQKQEILPQVIQSLGCTQKENKKND